MRSGSNIKSIKLGSSEFIIDDAANDVNKDHRKTGCVRFLRRDNNAFHFSDKKIGGLQPTGDALESGTGLNAHSFWSTEPVAAVRVALIRKRKSLWIVFT